MTSETFLITGGAGYIGSHVAWACVDAGHKIVVLDDLSTGREASIPPSAEFINGNLSDRALVRELLSDTKISGVMHFAGRIIVPESVENPVKYYTENTMATLGLLSDLLSYQKKPFLFSSTAAVYQPENGGAPLGEDDIKKPLSPYGKSKLMTEEMLSDIGAAHGLSSVVLRYFNVAGADPEGRTGQSGVDATHLLKVASQVALGQREKLQLYGDDYQTRDGTCIRDYIHVSDLASAHLLAMEHVLQNPGQHIFNCGYGRGASVKEVIAAVEQVTGETLPVEIASRRAGDAPSLVADVSRIRQILNWTPEHDSLEEMARSAIDWERYLSRIS